MLRGGININVVIEALINALVNGYVWLESIFGAIGIDLALIIVAFVSIGALYKFVLSPYLSGASDKAVRKK